MRNSILASAAVAALAIFVASPASASDLGGMKDDHVGTPDIDGRPAFIGLGIGVQGGGQFTNIDINDEFDGIGADGLVGGLHAEYLFGFGLGRFRVGPYVEGGISNVNVEIGGFDALNQDAYYGGGLKAGVVAFGSSLISARIGLERALWSTDFSDIDINVDSVVIGAGIETMVARNVSIGLTLDYLTPFNIEADGHDLTDLLDETEGFRGMARITYRQ